MADNSNGLDSIIERYGVPDPKVVGKLPRVTCKACRDSNTKVCDRHQKIECQECGNWITRAHLHLDYVGHAEVTRILTEIDPLWSWEPLALTAEGVPATRKVGKTVELWGRLMLLGHTRIGVGSCESGKADEGKELVGDFLRNAAMRFGVALSLWTKSEWQAEVDETPAEPARTETKGMNEPMPPRGPVPSPEEVTQAAALVDPETNPGNALIARYGSQNKVILAARKVYDGDNPPKTFADVLAIPALVADLLTQ